MDIDSNATDNATVCIETAVQRKPILADWPGPWEKWSRVYCYKNLWRIQHVIGNDIEDAIAECALVYVECRLRYGTRIVNQAHFCTLFKMAVACWFNTLSTKDSNMRKGIDDLALEQVHYRKHGTEVRIIEPSIKDEAELNLKLAEASSEIRDIVNIFCSAPEEIMETLRAAAPGRGTKEFFLTVLGHLGINKNKADQLIGELRQILTP